MAGLALEALLAGAIDYAGCFPPASLPLEQAVKNYLSYRTGPHGWMLGRFVVRVQDIEDCPPEINGFLSSVGGDHLRASAVEVQNPEYFQKPTYCEVSTESLGRVPVGAFAKIRTGGLVASAIPSSPDLMEFMTQCRRLSTAFKATAGLHHPLGGNHRLTYASDSPSARMYGFLNVLFAACWLRQGGSREIALAALEETDPQAFSWTDSGSWKDHSVDANQIVAARRSFIHSFGSCSFVEPVEELETLGWL
jgi:hypothetical protein